MRGKEKSRLASICQKVYVQKQYNCFVYKLIKLGWQYEPDLSEIKLKQKSFKIYCNPDNILPSSTANDDKYNTGDGSIIKNKLRQHVLF